MTKAEERTMRACLAKAIKKAMHVFIVSLHQDGYTNADIAMWASIFKGSPVSEAFILTEIKDEQYVL